MNQNQDYFWVAVLDDNSTIMEFNVDGTKNIYREIPRERVKLFGLQSHREAYFFDVTLGTLVSQTNKGDISYKIGIPLGKSVFNLVGRKPDNTKYNFFQIKEGNQQPPEPANYTKYLVGWREWKAIPKIGMKFVETSLVIDANTRKASIIINLRGIADLNSPPVCGSPFVTHL